MEPELELKKQLVAQLLIDLIERIATGVEHPHYSAAENQIMIKALIRGYRDRF